MRIVTRALPLLALLLLTPLVSSDTVRALPPPGFIDLFAGGGAGDGGPATSASLNIPTGIAVDGSGNVFIGDQLNCRVRQVSGGTISSVVGNGLCFPESPDGTLAAGAPDFGAIVATRGATMYFHQPLNAVRTISGGILGSVPGSNPPYLGAAGGMAFDASGDLYLAAPEQCILVEVSGGVANVIAGVGPPVPACEYAGDGGPATGAQLHPQDVAVEVVSGDIYIADKMNCRIRRISAGTIDTVAGTGTCGFNGDGPALTSMLNQPYGVAVDGAGDVLIVDKDNCRLRKLSGGAITTIAGSGACAFGGDGGAATAAALRFPTDVAVGPGGEIYVVDQLNCRVRVIVAGNIDTFAGNGFCTWSGDGTPATNAAIQRPLGLDVSSAGDVIIADSGNCRIRSVSAGVITTIAGNGNCFSGAGDGGPPLFASLRSPYAVEVHVSGDYYIVENTGCRIRKVSGGTISTVAGTGLCGYSGDGGSATAAMLSFPRDVAVTAGGDLYIADTGNCRVRLVSGGTISTYAGSGACNGILGDGGPPVMASVSAPESVELDIAGDLLIADTGHCRLRLISGGVIQTIAGNGVCSDYAPGAPATDAAIYQPVALAADATGKIFIVTLNFTASRCRVHMLLTGVVVPYAGTGSCVDSIFGNGVPALSAGFHSRGTAVGTAGELYLSESITNFGRTVRVVSAYLDGDGDGFGNEIDNCPSTANPSQLNNDRDLIDLTPPRGADDITYLNADKPGDACDPDDDNDGLTDADESSLPGPACPSSSAATDPFANDTDGDRFLDGAECARGTDPFNALSAPAYTSCGPAGDADGDILQNRVEICFYNSNPNSANTDGAQCTDRQEVASLNNDYIVNSLDQGLLASAVQPRPYELDFDLNRDGVINSLDQGILASAVGTSCP